MQSKYFYNEDGDLFRRQGNRIIRETDVQNGYDCRDIHAARKNRVTKNSIRAVILWILIIILVVVIVYKFLA